MLTALAASQSLTDIATRSFLQSSVPLSVNPFDTIPRSTFLCNVGYADWYHAATYEGGNQQSEQILETNHFSLQGMKTSRDWGVIGYVASHGLYGRVFDEEQKMVVRIPAQRARAGIAGWIRREWLAIQVSAGYSPNHPSLMIQNNPQIEYDLRCLVQTDGINGSIATSRAVRTAALPFFMVLSNQSSRTFPVACTQSTNSLSIEKKWPTVSSGATLDYAVVENFDQSTNDADMPIAVNGEGVKLKLHALFSGLRAMTVAGECAGWYGQGTVRGYDRTETEFMRLDSIETFGVAGSAGIQRERLHITLTGEWLKVVSQRGFFKTAAFSGWAMFDRVDYLLRDGAINWWAIGPQATFALPFVWGNKLSADISLQRFSLSCALTTIEKSVVILIPQYADPVVSAPVSLQGWLGRIALADTIRVAGFCIVPSVSQLIPVVDRSGSGTGAGSLSNSPSADQRTDWRGGTQYHLSVLLAL